jgi:hypothetical protein
MNCEHESMMSLDEIMDNEHCNCGVMVCLGCEAEFNKEGIQTVLGVTA